MPVKIRLARRGRKRKPIYDIVVADSRSPRDGKFIEKLGSYNPNVHPTGIRLDDTRALHWLMVGAQPTDTTRHLLSKEGLMLKKHLQVGVNKGAITQETADQRFEAWKQDRDAKLNTVVADLEKAQAEAKEKALKAEQEKAAAMAKAQAEAEAAANPQPEAEAAEGTEEVEAAAPEEGASAEEPKAE